MVGFSNQRGGTGKKILSGTAFFFPSITIPLQEFIVKKDKYIDTCTTIFFKFHQRGLLLCVLQKKNFRLSLR